MKDNLYVTCYILSLLVKTAPNIFLVWFKKKKNLSCIFFFLGHSENQYNTCLWMLIKSGKSEREAHEILKVCMINDSFSNLENMFQYLSCHFLYSKLFIIFIGHKKTRKKRDPFPTIWYQLQKSSTNVSTGFLCSQDRGWLLYLIIIISIYYYLVNSYFLIYSLEYSFNKELIF